jgi:hypothetical protein
MEKLIYEDIRMWDCFQYYYQGYSNKVLSPWIKKYDYYLTILLMVYIYGLFQNGWLRDFKHITYIQYKILKKVKWLLVNLWHIYRHSGTVYRLNLKYVRFSDSIMSNDYFMKEKQGGTDFDLYTTIF